MIATLDSYSKAYFFQLKITENSEMLKQCEVRVKNAIIPSGKKTEKSDNGKEKDKKIANKVDQVNSYLNIFPPN